MAVPKRKTSKSRKKMRRRSHKVTLAPTQKCEKCGAPRMPHRVCPKCGTYNGRQVVIVEED